MLLVFGTLVLSWLQLPLAGKVPVHPPAPLAVRRPVVMFAATQAKAQLAPTGERSLRQHKRPMGRNQLGQPAYAWLQREMQWLAQEYLLLVEQEGHMSGGGVEEQGLLLKVRERFEPPKLAEHLERRLVAAPPAAEHLPNATLAAAHEPTVWAAFQLNVQHKLQRREPGEGAPIRPSSPLKKAESPRCFSS